MNTASSCCQDNVLLIDANKIFLKNRNEHNPLYDFPTSVLKSLKNEMNWKLNKGLQEGENNIEKVHFD